MTDLPADMGSPNKYGRRTGAEAGSELSLALLATIREAVTSPSTHTDIPLEVCRVISLFWVSIG